MSMVVKYKGREYKASKVNFDVSNECGVVISFIGEQNGMIEGVDFSQLSITEQYGKKMDYYASLCSE